VVQPSSTLARFYRVDITRAGDVALALTDAPIADINVCDGELAGLHISVATRAVAVRADDHGALRGDAVEAIAPRNGTLCFDPSQGGVRTRENRRARGAFNALVTEANWFGMVNAYAHADIAVRYANSLLAELGAPPVPHLRVVAGAHFGSQLPGYAECDGDFRNGQLRPLSGGHYRLSTRTSGVPELLPVNATGEIHLGPSRYRKPFAGRVSYLRNAAHNPAIIYHEVGHHVCRHTADFRCNAERRPDHQRNGKPGVEEGVCDYFAAALLGSGRPYGWYRADRGRRRDVEELRPASNDHGNSHAVGATWAAALWRSRAELLESGIIDNTRTHDRAVVDLLLRLGAIGRGGKRRTRATREKRRGDASTVIATYLEAMTEAAGWRAAEAAARIFDRAGLAELPNTIAEARPC
jgi:hypothetical protein